MNAPERLMLLPDIQSQADPRGVALDAVGVKGVRYPLTVKTQAGQLSTIANLSMTVGLGAEVKGTHMSRFIELLESQSGVLDQNGFEHLLRDMLHRLNASAGALEMSFPYFVRKIAPVSGVASHLDCDVSWRGTISQDQQYGFWMRAVVPVTSLCPCSKEISAYGAHNQRSLISMDVALREPLDAEALIAAAERSASCEVYGLLKRPDEKYVTERAYDNPKFVEDLVRDVALALDDLPSIKAYRIEAENFESIHNHSAYARVVRNGQPLSSPL